ncbi:MAG: hypothetical protein J3Q66DRAFT_445374 [Benniella sp.]|nr:MAG: hypothetical protein J3Q66DRAFT_445374 [Benniella sp.]
MKLVCSLLPLISAVVTLVQGDSRFLSSKAIFTGVDHSDRDTEFDKMFEDPRNHEGTTHVLKLTGGRNRHKEQIATVHVPFAGGMKADVAAAAFVEQIPKSTKKIFSGTWTLVLITIHGSDDNKVSVDLSTHGPFQVSAEVLERESTLYGLYYPKVDVKTLLDTLTTPKSKSSDYFLDAWISESDHSCETKFQSSKYAHHQSLYRMSQLRMDK